MKKKCTVHDIRKLIKKFNSQNKDIEACNDPELAVGVCEPVTVSLTKFFNDYCSNVNVLRFSEAKFDIVDGAEEYQQMDSSDIGHTALKVGDYVVDLTSAQFGKNYPQRNIVKLSEIEPLWEEIDIAGPTWGTHYYD